MNETRKGKAAMGDYAETLFADTRASIERRHRTVDDIRYIRSHKPVDRFLGDWRSFQREVGDHCALGGDIDEMFMELDVVFDDDARMYRYIDRGPGKWRWKRKPLKPGRNDFAIASWDGFFKDTRTGLLTPVDEGSSRREHILHIIDTWMRSTYIYMMDRFRQVQTGTIQEWKYLDRLDPGRKGLVDDKECGLAGYSDLTLRQISSTLEHMGRTVTDDSVLCSDMTRLDVRGGGLDIHIGTSWGEHWVLPELKTLERPERQNSFARCDLSENLKRRND